MDKYIQEDYHGFITHVYISHMDCGHHKGRIYVLKHTTNVMCIVNTSYLLIGYNELATTIKYVGILNL